VGADPRALSAAAAARQVPPDEREGNNLQGYRGLCLKNGSSPRPKSGLDCLLFNVPNSLDCLVCAIFALDSGSVRTRRLSLPPRPRGRLLSHAHEPRKALRTLNQTSFLEDLSTFGDKYPQNGSKNDTMAPRTTL